jgi:hypothetical protein
MDAPPATQQAALEVAAPDSTVRPRWLGWLTIQPLAVAVVASAAVAVQDRFAPLLLGPILIGVALGWIAAKSAAACWVRNATAIVVLAGVAGASLVPAMHVIGWLQFRANYNRPVSGDPRLALVRSLTDTGQPPDLLTFLQVQARRGRHWIGGRQTGAVVWWSWGLDAVLAASAGAVVALILRGRPVSPTL